MEHCNALVDALALGAEPGKCVAARLLSLLGEAEGIACAADVLLLHELDLLLGGANVLLLLLLGRQLAVAVGAIAARASTVATGRRLAVAGRLLRLWLLLALGGIAEEVVPVGVGVVGVCASQAAVASRPAGALLGCGRAAIAVAAVAGLGAIAASLGTVSAATSTATAAILLAGAGDGGCLLQAVVVVGARVLGRRRRLCVGVLCWCGGVCCVLAGAAVLRCCCAAAVLLRGRGGAVHGLLCGAALSPLRLPKRALRLPSSSPASPFLLPRKRMVAVVRCGLPCVVCGVWCVVWCSLPCVVCGCG